MQARTASHFAGLVAILLAIAGAHAQAASSAAPGHSGDTILDRGEATWYGGRHQGLRTFSGERFDAAKMTAAHSSLPIGTMVRVTDVTSGRSVIVRVNDREPPHGVRCIDLSEGAAYALGMHARGVAEVTLSAVADAGGAGVAPVEVAEAPEALPPGGDFRANRTRSTSRHGRQHRRRAAR